MTLVRPLIHFGHLLYRTLQVVEGRLRALKKKEKQERKIKYSPRDRKKKSINFV